MKLNPITLALMSAAFLSQSVSADDLSELKSQLQAMQKQIQIMQMKLDAQDTALKKQEQISAKIQHQQAPGHTGEMTTAGKIANSMIVSGAIEIKALDSNSKDWSGDSESDIIVDTLELGIDTSAGDWVSAHMLFLYEQDPGPGRDTDDLQVDEAYITFSNSAVTPFYATAGRIYVPFGNFESNMISDPVTLTMAETRSEVLQLGVEMDNGFYGSGYIFNGDIPESKSNMSDRSNSQIDNYGLNLGYVIERDGFFLDIGAGYINNIAAASGLYDAMDGNAACGTAGDKKDCIKDYVGGMSFHAIANIGSFNLIGEYVSATDDFAVTDFTYASATGKKLRPKAWNLEGAYSFNLVGKEAVFAVGYQKTDDFYLQDSTYYFEKAWLGSLSVALEEGTSLAVEWRHAKAYDEVENVHDNDFDDENLLQVKLSYEF